MQPKSTSKKSYPITGYPNNNDKKNILLSKEHLVIQISLVFLFWNSHRPLLPRMRIPSSIHKRPLYSRVEGGRKGKREAREERNGKREALASTVYIYIYEAFSCSREPDTGREGIKQTGRQDADGGRVGLNACGCLNRTQPRCSAISRVPVAPEMLPNSLHLRPALYSPGNALSPFLKVQEAARTAFPSLSGPCNSLSLSFSRSHLLPFPFLFSFSTSIPCNEQLPSLVEGKGREGPLPLPTWHRNRGENALPWWWWWKRGGTRLERETFTLLPSFALTPIALDFHLEEAGCAEGSYEEITSGCTVTKRLFVFFFFGISSLVLPMNLEWEFFFKSFFLLLLFCCFAFPWFSLLSFFFVFFWPGMELKLFAWKIF